MQVFYCSKIWCRKYTTVHIGLTRSWDFAVWTWLVASFLASLVSYFMQLTRSLCIAPARPRRNGFQSLFCAARPADASCIPRARPNFTPVNQTSKSRIVRARLCRMHPTNHPIAYKDGHQSHASANISVPTVCLFFLFSYFLWWSSVDIFLF